jgi:hypothetical protein
MHSQRVVRRTGGRRQVVRIRRLEVLALDSCRRQEAAGDTAPVAVGTEVNGRHARRRAVPSFPDLVRAADLQNVRVSGQRCTERPGGLTGGDGWRVVGHCGEGMMRRERSQRVMSAVSRRGSRNGCQKQSGGCCDAVGPGQAPQPWHGCESALACVP